MTPALSFQHAPCHSERSEESQSASRRKRRSRRCTRITNGDGRGEAKLNRRLEQHNNKQLKDSELALRSACIRGSSSASIRVNAVPQRRDRDCDSSTRSARSE